MVDKAVRVTIEPALASRIARAAEAAGQRVDAYVNGLLDTELIGPADWDEIDRICDRAAKDGIPWEEFETRLRSLGRPR
jgi:hypothetical protein